jgi:hypothetical protein
MKVILTEAQIITLKRNSQELDEMSGLLYRRELDPLKRYKLVANAVIDYMIEKGMDTIPNYSTLTQDDTYSVDVSKHKIFPGEQGRFKWKTLIPKFLIQGEYNKNVKPLIAQMRPEFKEYSTGYKVGAKSYITNDGIPMSSLGEIILYNTFKRNGITLEYEAQDQKFNYTIIDSNGNEFSHTKEPDFYWREKDLLIEVAGLTERNNRFKNYDLKLNYAKNEMDKQNKKFIILDYYSSKNNQIRFYKLVCDTFNFHYNEMDYFKVVSHKGIDRDYCERVVREILTKGMGTSGAERERATTMMKNCLSRTVHNDDGTFDEVSYTSKWDVRRDMGLLKSTNPEIIKKVQMAWCKSPFVSYKKIAVEYTKIYNEKMAHNTVEIIMKNNKNVFDKNNKEDICKKFNDVKSDEKELGERSRTLANARKKRLFPKSAIMANPLRFKKYDKEVRDLNEIQTREKKILGKGREREVYLSHINPNLVFKLWGYDDLVKEKEFFDKYPNLYVKIYKVRTYENPHYSNIGVAIMDRVDTKGFKQEIRKLYNTLESVGYEASLFNLIDASRREKKYDEIVDKLNEYDPSMADFFINFRDCVVGVEDSLGRFNYFDRSFEQFGLDKEGNVKCFDV